MEIIDGNGQPERGQAKCMPVIAAMNNQALLRWGRGLWAAVLCAFFAAGGVARAYDPPTNIPLKQFFLVESYPKDAGPFNAVRVALYPVLRYRMMQELPGEAVLTDLEMMNYARFTNDAALGKRLKEELGKRVCDMVIAVGDPAVRLMANVRDEVFPGKPALFLACDAQQMGPDIATSNTVVMAQRNNPAAAISNILQVLPGTTNIVVVGGDSPFDLALMADYRRAFAGFTNRVGFQWLDKLFFEQIKEACSNLPPRNAIFFTTIIKDGANMEYNHNVALRELCTVANAPVFVLYESQFVEGVMGGPLMPNRSIGEQAAQVAFRILSGEKPGSIATRVFEIGTPVYDGRALRRWNVDEKNLPPGSRVVFRPPTLWDQYRVQIVVLLAGVIAQTGLIVALLVHRVRLVKVQREVLRQRTELAHIARVTMLGELSASMAHELNQPLGAIMRNAEAAELFLQNEQPDLPEVQAILTDIRQDGRRAGAVIDRMRDLIKRRDVELRPLDINVLAAEDIDLVRPDAAMRRVRLVLETSPDAPHVLGDRVQLQQVLLNLLLNAMDAMQDVPPGGRLVTVKVRVEGSSVMVTVSDNGHGIPPNNLSRIFEPFFTSKANGLGMGLVISRGIIEAHGGRLWAVNNPAGGALFSFTLPMKNGGHAE